jgi:hypothetical protein
VPMPRKELELPLDVVRNFVRDMRAFHAEKDAIKRDEIAARQSHVLRQYPGRRERMMAVNSWTGLDRGRDGIGRRWRRTVAIR